MRRRLKWKKVEVNESGLMEVCKEEFYTHEDFIARIQAVRDLKKAFDNSTIIYKGS